MSTAYSAFAGTGPANPRPSPAARLPRSVVLLALVVVVVVATLPLASAALDRRADARNTLLDASDAASDAAGDFGPINQED